MATTITTNQAPAAKPLAQSITATTNWVTMLEAPEYDIPVVSLGSDRRIAPALVEIASPVIACCRAAQSVVLDVRIQRADNSEAFLARGVQVVPGETTFIPLNGTMLTTGDRLQAKADLADEADLTISATVGQAEEDDVS